MYTIHGIHFSPNTTKIIYVAEALGIGHWALVMTMSK